MEWLGEQKVKHPPSSRVKCAQCKLKAMSKIILKKELLCNLFEMFFRSWSNPLSVNCIKRGIHVIMSEEKNSCANVKWAWKGNGPKLLTPIASNKNWQWSNTNLTTIKYESGDNDKSNSANLSLGGPLRTSHLKFLRPTTSRQHKTHIKKTFHSNFFIKRLPKSCRIQKSN